jgi:hypothetical protein
MTDSAALLADEVLPAKPIRQWVLSLPLALRCISMFISTFSCSTGRYRVGTEPPVFRRIEPPGSAGAAGAARFEVGTTIAVALLTGLLALFRFLRGRRKGRIDQFYSAVLAIRAKLAQESGAERRSQYMAELRTLRDNTFSLLIKEKLAADDSFRIFQSLLYDITRECEAPAPGTPGQTR